MTASSSVTPVPARTGDRDHLLASLLADCGRGHASALAELFDQTSCATLQVARCVAADEGAAQQAVHDAYVEVWQRAVAGRTPTQDVGLWVLALAHRHARRAAVAA